MAVSGSWLLSSLALVSVLVLSAPAIQSAERIPLDISGENQVLHLQLQHYTLTDKKLGEPAVDGSQYLVVRGTLTNKNQQQGLDIPPVQKAFPLRLNGKDIVELNPLSEDTADPFWGPLVLMAGEQHPVEMVFSVPAGGVESAEIRHLSSMGAINLFVIGVAPRERTEFLAGPVTLGDARLAIGALERAQDYRGRPAKTGYYFLRLQFWYTNLRELQPLETNIASLSALVEDGYYVYHSETLAGPGEVLPIEFYAAGESTAGELVFEVPEDHGHLELAHYTPSGPIRLTLTPNLEKPSTPQIIAGPSRQGRIEVSVFSERITAEGLVLDVGLRLNMDNPMADMTLDLGRAFELHEPSGKFTNSTPALAGIEHPISEVVLRRDQLVRGELGFRGVEKHVGQVLILPLASGRVSLALGQGSGAVDASGQRPELQGDPASTSHRKTSPPTPAAAQLPASLPRASAPQPEIHTGIPEVLDTGTLSVNWKILQLYGVGGQGEPFRGELESYIGDRFVRCEPASKGFHKCMIDDVDLSELVLRNGAGSALSEAPVNLRAAESHAKDKGIGIWQK